MTNIWGEEEVNVEEEEVMQAIQLHEGDHYDEDDEGTATSKTNVLVFLYDQESKKQESFCFHLAYNL